MRKSTKRQKFAVTYCEQWLGIDFKGNRDSFSDCNKFLNLYLEDAQQTERELNCEYEAYIEQLDN